MHNNKYGNKKFPIKQLSELEEKYLIFEEKQVSGNKDVCDWITVEYRVLRQTQTSVQHYLMQSQFTNTIVP